MKLWHNINYLELNEYNCVILQYYLFYESITFSNYINIEGIWIIGVYISQSDLIIGYVHLQAAPSPHKWLEVELKEPGEK